MIFHTFTVEMIALFDTNLALYCTILTSVDYDTFPEGKLIEGVFNFTDSEIIYDI